MLWIDAAAGAFWIYAATAVVLWIDAAAVVLKIGAAALSSLVSLLLLYYGLVLLLRCIMD